MKDISLPCLVEDKRGNINVLNYKNKKRNFNMQKEEIIGGLKNGLEKGYSLEQVKASFINAGYNPRDVEDSASFISSGGVLTMPAVNVAPITRVSELSGAQSGLAKPFSSNTQFPTAQANQTPSVQQLPVMQKQIEIKPKKSRKTLVLVLLLSFVLVLLLGVLFSFIFAKEWVLGLLKTIGIGK